MNLVWFLTIGTVLSLILGEFGQFPFGSNLSISLTDILLGITLTFLFIWQIGIKKQLLMPFGFKLLILFWIIAAASLLFSKNFGGGLYLVRFIFYSLSFYLGYILVKSNLVKDLNLIKLLIIPISLFTLAGFVQLLVMPDLARLEEFGYDPHKNRLVSTFLDPNFAGAFLNIGLIYSTFLFIKEKKFKWLLICLSLFLAIILTFSRSSYLMFIIGIGLTGIFKFRKLLVVLIAALIIIYALTPRIQERIQGIWNLDITAAERIESWRVGMEIFKKQPLGGVGFNNLSSALEEYNLLRTHQDLNTHSVSGVDSSLIFVLATTGIIGFVSFLAFWGYILLKFMKDRKDELSLVTALLIVALIINSQFINSLFYPPIMLTIFLISGAFYAKSK